MERFETTTQYKLIYVFSVNDDKSKGLLKVGETTLHSSSLPNALVPNCRELNQAAKKRIGNYGNTISADWRLEYTELAIRVLSNGYMSAFRDKDVHNVLMNSGVAKKQPNGRTGEEWFDTNLDTVIAAIKAVKDGKQSIVPISKIPAAKVDFREEQLAAIEQTVKTFRKDNEMLWYAKMRFGKTLSALEVVRRMQFRRVIIVTHRPVVDDGWSEDFKKIFFEGNSEHPYQYVRKTKDSAYTFDEKTDSENDAYLRRLDANGSHFLYFASIQDLRGSQLVGGNFNKNNAVFALDWDCIIVDEAHEGTQTELGDAVITKLRKDKTKILALSGTPFNLLSHYGEDAVYTWDYVMEQKKKTEWDLLHPGEHNPYADLPKMHIYTYDLGETLRKYVTDEYESKAFNFREFFRVWSRGPSGHRAIPSGAVEGAFVHEADVISFLNLMVREDKDSVYPFSTQEYRNMFRHTLWMVPGVKEAKALSALLHRHPVFGDGKFGIANVAGNGDLYEEEHAKDALALVRKTIRDYDYSITLSCGKLTTGVTVPEWTAVLMLSGTYSTAASQYMQTIFRVQSAGSINGLQKTDCYVFDFAPDRTLKVLTETVHLSRKPGKSQEKRREAMAEFLNYCPVIAIAGSRMKNYSVNSMMEQIKQIYAERAVNSGFDDDSIYNDELLRLDELDAAMFNNLRDIIGTSKGSGKKGEVDVNNQGLTDEQVEIIDDEDTTPEKPPKKELTPEEKAQRKALEQAKKNRKKAIDILRGISIRMPLLIYGADVPIDEDIDVEHFVDMIDDSSWEEFMPNGVSKEIFLKFTKYYDRDVFIAAGKRIRRLAAAADKETPTRRVQMIAEIFKHFKNPDKETVLTPWRVVNLHMSDTIGGWCFFNDNFEEDFSGIKKRLEEPRFVNQGAVTSDVFAENAKILELNSKTGLYPLYMAYSSYKQKMEGMSDDDWEPKDCQEFWDETLENNIFVICKTPMAKSITKRTLCGYSRAKVNIHYFDDLVNMLRNKPEQFQSKVLKGNYWGKEVTKMTFDAVVGNPPYQTSTSLGSQTNGQVAVTNIFQYFQMAADQLSSGAVSLIYPGARWLHRSGKGLAQFGLEQINDKNLERVIFYPDAQEIFKDVAIADGITIVYKNSRRSTPGFVYDYRKSGTSTCVTMLPPGDELVPLNPKNNSVVSKAVRFVEDNNLCFLHDRILPRSLFGIESNFVEDHQDLVRLFSNDADVDFTTEIKLLANDRAGKAGRSTWFVIRRENLPSGVDFVNKWKVVVSSANAGGQKRDNQLQIIDNHSAFGRSRVALAAFDNKEEAINFYKFCQTPIVRFLFLMTDEALSSLAKKVPDLMNYTDHNGRIDFSGDINKQLCAQIGLTEEEQLYVEQRTKVAAGNTSELA